MNGVTHAAVAYIVGLGFLWGYALWIILESRRLRRRTTHHRAPAIPAGTPSRHDRI